MIVTVTMNPSLDMAYALPHLVIDDVNRVASVEKTAGGKGLNVTRVLHQLGADVTATGLIGGNIGRFITDQLDDSGISHAFYPINGETRHSIAILHDDSNQTELLETGPEVSAEEKAGFLQEFKEMSSKAEVITISGSLPKGLPADFYQELIAGNPTVPVLLDTSGATLEASLKGSSKPFLIKPNLSELQTLVGSVVSLEDMAGLKDVLSSELFAGLEWIVISMGGQGALAKHGSDFYRVEIPKISIVNPVGSGDSTIAGLACGIAKGLDPEDILKTGMVAGMLNAQEAKTGWIKKENFDDLYRKISVSALG